MHGCMSFLCGGRITFRPTWELWPWCFTFTLQMNACVMGHFYWPIISSWQWDLLSKPIGMSNVIPGYVTRYISPPLKSFKGRARSRFVMTPCESLLQDCGSEESRKLNISGRTVFCPSSRDGLSTHSLKQGKYFRLYLFQGNTSLKWWLPSGRWKPPTWYFQHANPQHLCKANKYVTTLM